MTEKKQELTEERVREIVRGEIAKYLQGMLGEEEVRQLNAEVTALLASQTASVDSQTKSHKP